MYKRQVFSPTFADFIHQAPVLDLQVFQVHCLFKAGCKTILTHCMALLNHLVLITHMSLRRLMLQCCFRSQKYELEQRQASAFYRAKACDRMKYRTRDGPWVI